MNDNKKRPLEVALDAVEESGKVSDRAYDEALTGLRAILEEDRRSAKDCRSIH